VYIVYFWRRAGLSASAELLVILVVNCSASCVRTLLVKLRNYRTALRRAHTSAKVTVPAKLLLLNKRSVKHTQYAGYDSAHTYKPSIAESFILRPPPNHNRNRKSTLQLLGVSDRCYTTGNLAMTVLVLVHERSIVFYFALRTHRKIFVTAVS